MAAHDELIEGVRWEVVSRGAKVEVYRDGHPSTESALVSAWEEHTHVPRDVAWAALRVVVASLQADDEESPDRWADYSDPTGELEPVSLWGGQ